MATPNRVDYDELDFDYSPDGVLCLWEGQPFTGVGVELYPDGTLQAESLFRNGIDTRIGSLWYVTGQLRRRATANEANHTMQVTEWYENGKLKSQTTYEHGIKTAEQSWNEQGDLLTDFHLTEQDEYYPALLRYREGNHPTT
ncbi:toxin-antitoxin system YwqK family antitoxin [Hymenobacter cellulosilyticus]|uniref:Toxin-antitoxin system YwqK family antitoxin n=1 Tax=Hymenobacter cellulosilyticus TaxID=2932248 RepID=A0A8T9Q6W2_9BACT|nr:hypothetical protein [Hymenobacter cellulosilyticus]UOQ72682.1 hypothetical protein MUN79_01415 [Hymenobacter cellulosilyticus]